MSQERRGRRVVLGVRGNVPGVEISPETPLEGFRAMREAFRKCSTWR